MTPGPSLLQDPSSAGSEAPQMLALHLSTSAAGAPAPGDARWTRSTSGRSIPRVRPSTGPPRSRRCPVHLRGTTPPSSAPPVPDFLCSSGGPFPFHHRGCSSSTPPRSTLVPGALFGRLTSPFSRVRATSDAGGNGGGWSAPLRGGRRRRGRRFVHGRRWRGGFRTSSAC